MYVQRVLVAGLGGESWTVLDDEGAPIAAIERFLAYLSVIERSPNTVKAYAHDLKDFFEFLMVKGVVWERVSLELLGQYVSWLRLAPAARSGRVALLPSVPAHLTASSVNRKLAALGAFYQHAARGGVDVGDLLVTWRPGGRGTGAWKPFLHHVSKGAPHQARAIVLKEPRRLPRVLTAVEAQAILDACRFLRDRFLFALLYETGMRIGEALGLRHEDIAAAEREIAVRHRDNANGARSKSAGERVVPVSAQLLRLYADYLHQEYGQLDSDYVFVNLRAAPLGRALEYRAAYDLVQRLRRRTGIEFSPHWFRHTAATRLLRDGVPIEIVSTLLGHSSITTTLSIYGHLTAADARAVLDNAGWFADTQVAW